MEMYKKEGINLVTRYTVEFIDNKKDFDIVCSGKNTSIEPWERYKKRVFGNMDSALSFYMVYLVRDGIFDIKLFEEIILDGETIREAYIEPESTTSYYLKNTINKSLYEQNSKISKQAELLENENNLYKAFINKFNVSNTFNDFIKQDCNKSA